MSDYNDGILPTPCLRMDTHFGDEYESVEFGDGTGYIKAAPILAKVGALHEEIDRLRDESGFLHECIVLNARDANAENDKLRELAILNWEWAHSCCGNNCKMQTNDCGYQIDRDCNYEREIWDRMRELGIEVDG